MQATDGDRVVELPPDVVLEVARAYARKAARTPLKLLSQAPWVLRALLGREADTPFNKKRSRRHDIQRRGEGVLEDGYQFRVIAELFHAERTSHHKTWHSVCVALREELERLFKTACGGNTDEDRIRYEKLSQNLGRLIAGTSFSSQLVYIVQFGDFPLLLHLLWVRGGVPLMNMVNERGQTPLCTAVAKNHVFSVDHLLRLGADVDGAVGREPNFFTPLLLAARLGHIDVAEVLLRHNAAAVRTPTTNLFPSDIAVRCKHFGLAVVLRRYEREQERRRADGGDA